MDNIGKWFIVLGSDDSIICCSKAINEKVADGKHVVDFISFDDKYFFNRKSKNIKIIELKKVDQIIPFDFSKHSLNTVKWIDFFDYSDQQFFNKINDIDLAIENDYSELDVEVQPLCNGINRYLNGMGKTLASCSGHGLNSLWVAIQFFDIRGISQILKLINSTEEFKEGFILQSIFIDNYQKYTPNVLSNPVLRLTTASLGKKAYILAQKLSEFIDTINVQ